jgi:NAD(P)-dependent dehydrogenase (short-subunit alcohol dehydrogenase family)
LRWSALQSLASGAMSAEQQHPLGSGYGATSTASEVLAGIDLSGRYVVVSGGYSGIGLETTRALVAAGAEVAVPARRPELAREQLAGLAGVEVEVGTMDLADQASVAAYADRLLAQGRHVDAVIGSAGVMAPPLTRVGPGWELQLAANHLGHYALVNRLWPLLRGGARVVVVSSRANHNSGMRWADPFFEREAYDPWLAYGQSKSANVLFAVHLDRLAQEYGVRAFALHPGAIVTPLSRHMSTAELQERGAVDEDGTPVIGAEWKTPEQGAATQVWAATSPRLDGLGGLYLEDCDVAVVAPENGRRVGVQPWAIDAGEAERLWSWSAELTGVDAFA